MMNSYRSKFDLSLDPSGTSMLCEIPDWDLLMVSGGDAEKFLQGQTTCDFRQLGESGALPGALCNPKGRVLATFLAFRMQDSIALRMPRELIETIASHLQRYAVFFDAQISSAESKLGLALTGEGQTEPMETPPDAARVSRPGLTEVWCPAQYFRDYFDSLASDYPVSTPDWWAASLIRRGEAQIFAATSGEFLAHQLSLDLAQAISFRKGCYTGQEIIARTHYRGKSKKRLACLLLAGADGCRPGTEILNPEGRTIGHALLSASSADQSLVQATLPDNLDQRGELSIDNLTTGYQLLDLPFQTGAEPR